MVPINTALSAFILYDMFGWKIVVCYIGMIILLLIQIITNKINATFYKKHLVFTDKRMEYLRNVLSGIRQIKVRCLEPFFNSQLKEIRAREISIFTTYCDIRIISSSLYFNSGIILSTALFLSVDRDILELGKVFSTLALLGYVFNFSVLFSNYAIEALNLLWVFFGRVEMAITRPFQDSQKAKAEIVQRESGLKMDNYSVNWYPEVKKGET